MFSLVLSGIFVLSASAARAEEWVVFRDAGDAWALEISSINRAEQTGFTTIRLGRFYRPPQTEGATSWSYDIRRYLVDCAKDRVRHFMSERYTDNGRQVPTISAGTSAVWEQATSGWSLKAKTFACETVLPTGIKVESKASAMAMMQTLPSAAVAPVKPATETTSVAAPAPDELCSTVKKILGEGQRETPFFKSFYASDAERQKYAGKGSTPIPGFGACTIQQSATPDGRFSPVFASYQCERDGGSDASNASFAKDVSNRVAACLPTGTYVEGDDMGHAIRSYEHALSLAGFPRVRVRHTAKGVSIHLETK